MKGLDRIYNLDARKISEKFDKPFVDATITSPPYFDLKDYGHKDQIGFGQNYEAYLNDLESVFRQTYQITKDSGSLWVIIDTFRKGGMVYPLPFDFADKIKDAGWKLQDILIWNKDRTVPWAHKGQMRNLFEYILVFSKTDDFKYRIDRIREFTDLKRWWVKYPERYNPQGKNPAGIWKFDIPTQGSWGSGYINHFCPLPEALVQRIIKLTTDEGDVVFDPFAGSGTVPAQANFMKRHYAGFELNKDYLKLFDKYLKGNLVEKRKEYLAVTRNNHDQEKFQKLILDLRSLKYASVILKKVLLEKSLSEITQIYVERVGVSNQKNKMIKVKYCIQVRKKSDIRTIKKFVESLSAVQPLSKFGIEPVFSFSEKAVVGRGLRNKVFCYQINSPNKYKEVIEIGTVNVPYPLISPIGLNLNEKDYH